MHFAVLVAMNFIFFFFTSPFMAGTVHECAWWLDVVIVCGHTDSITLAQFAALCIWFCFCFVLSFHPYHSPLALPRNVVYQFYMRYFPCRYLHLTRTRALRPFAGQFVYIFYYLGFRGTLCVGCICVVTNQLHVEMNLSVIHSRF